jgi:hypothetical protein
MLPALPATLTLRRRTVRRAAHASLFLLLLAATGCAPLQDIRDFAALSKAATTRLPEILADYKRSVLAQSQRDFIVLKGVRWADSEKQAQADCDALIIPETKLSPCRDLENLRDGMRVVDAYLDTMGKLAGNELGNYDQAIDGIASKLTAFQIRKAEGAAIGGLAKLLNRIYTQGKRQKELREALRQSDPNLAEILEGYKLIVKGYLVVLGNEEQQFRGLLPNAFITPGASETSEARYIRGLGVYAGLRHQEEIRAKRARAEAFLKGIQKVRDGHHELTAKSSSLNGNDLTDTARKYVAELVPLVQTLQTALFQ